MRAFRLTDTAFAELAAGRPSATTVADLRKAQISRHLLLLGETLKLPGGKTPRWYADPPGDAARAEALADPMIALHTAATLAALRSRTAPPPDHVASPHRLNTTHDGLTLRLRLEDADPLRARLGLTPSRQLTAPEVADWQRLVDEAWRLLVTRHRAAASTVAAVLRVLVPIEPDPGSAGLSATSAEAFGAVALSAPADAVSLAVGLLHETQHNLLNATRTLFDLVEPGAAPAMYSPWREDPRPPIGLLHGAYAYQAITRFWRVEGGRLAQFEFARWRVAVVESADALLSGPYLTAAGMRFVSALRDEVSRWRDAGVDDGIERLARDANLEHRVRWRLRNLAVETGPLVAAWRQGRRPVLPEPTLRAGGGRALERSDRLDLVHRVLREPAGTAAPWGEGDQSLPPGGRVRPGDAAWLRAQSVTALSAYRKRLESMRRPTHPDGPPSLREGEVWAGIALVSPRRCVRERPEVVRSLYLALGDVPLDKITIWLDGVLNPRPR